MKHPYIVILSLVLSIGACCKGHSQVAAIGQVLTFNGKVQISHAKQHTRACCGMDQLLVGDIVEAGSNASASVVLYDNGARCLVPAHCRAQVQRTALQWLSGPKLQPLKALSHDFAETIKIPSSPLGPKFAGVVVRTMDDSKVGPRFPWPDGTIKESRARLRWNGPMEQGTETLHLRIREAKGGKTIEEKNLPPSSSTFDVPDGLLKPECWYFWTIKAMGTYGAGQTSGGRLRLLSPKDRSKAERLQKEADRLRETDRDDAASDLLLAQGLERLGLTEDAKDAYESALRFGPNPGAEAALLKLRQRN